MADYQTPAIKNGARKRHLLREDGVPVQADELICSWLHLKPPAPERFSTNRNPETQQADRELRHLIQSEISKLSANSAEMFVLKYFEGYDNKEIAQMLGTSHLVVGVLLHRARAAMKKRIEASF